MLKLQKKDLKIGFEFEFLSPTIKKIHGPAWSAGNLRIRTPVGTIGTDGDNFELRTPPTSAMLAQKILKESLKVLRNYEAKTTKTTGLHINVSCRNKRMHPKINPLKLWQLAKPEKWAKSFGRRNSYFCSMPKNPNLWETFCFLGENHSNDEKNIAINFQEYGKKPKKSSRIEFRFPGGKNYHRKPKTLARCLNEIIKATSKSYDF